VSQHIVGRLARLKKDARRERQANARVLLLSGAINFRLAAAKRVVRLALGLMAVCLSNFDIVRFVPNQLAATAKREPN
jgi:hypothetical protein